MEEFLQKLSKRVLFMNKQKGENMNNLKKIGLTALAGSLAAVSANAIEMSVSGATSVSYTSTQQQQQQLVRKVLEDKQSVLTLQLCSMVQVNLRMVSLFHLMQH